MSRFVVLRHDSPAGLHWDFMLEFADVLRTWALQEEPAAERPIAARALADHRLAYLDYEGPVSGERGSVSKWDRGAFEAVEVEDDLVVVRLAGKRLLGLVTLELVADSSGEQGDSWQFRFTPE